MLVGMLGDFREMFSSLLALSPRRRVSNDDSSCLAWSCVCRSLVSLVCLLSAVSVVSAVLQVVAALLVCVLELLPLALAPAACP